MNGADLAYCCGCSHLTTVHGGLSHCNYFLDTGVLRGCPAGVGCERHSAKNGRPVKRRIAPVIIVGRNTHTAKHIPRRLEIGGVEERQIEAECSEAPEALSLLRRSIKPEE